ncbi:MAG: gamma-glutamyl-gamma-aminobutyrate hydrolase family protein [Tepidimonas sp.]|uniref:gamma-glutamyl-gamma-aminobutyrate hydrolase family protein n=1 Tax=Tepidimonas sp. TaxID=2002775 RepID=UPI00298F1C17|nr:gamma-glutamyl-gamma-aminobutyrate hydrolase family protein [Tepidimonas sp.]MCS6810757.1 gamma-glutamyl-gamma-aminobutyrate hydrolase family protein [Tepidimonas sp.]
MMDPATMPWVWMPADHRWLGETVHAQPYLVLGDKYARAVKDGARAQPVVFPLTEPQEVAALLAQVDGVVLTGSPSNVHPRHFGEEVLDPQLPLDEARDALTLELVRQALQQDVPLLGICRGFQEINVALGGSLHQAVHTLPGHLDHREPKQAPLEQQYAPRHDVTLQPGSLLHRLAGGAPVVRVNSLHGQGIKRLAPGLRAVAHAPDGLIEAVEFDGAHSFALAVQWHPEWRFGADALSSAIFRAFGVAVRQRQARRLREARAFASAPETPA